MKGAPIGRVALFILLGLILGGFLGEIIAISSAHLGEALKVGRDNSVHYIFTQFLSVDWGFGFPPGSEFVLDLFLIKIKLGVALKLNLGCIPGLALSLYLEKWSR